MIFATIVTGNADLADVCYLIAAVVFVLAAVAGLVTQATRYASPLIALGLALVAVGWLVL